VQITIIFRSSSDQGKLREFKSPEGWFEHTHMGESPTPGATPKPNTQPHNIPFMVQPTMAERTFTARLTRDPDSGYYAVRCVELPEAISQGKTEKEALANIKEAVELVLEEYEAEARKEGGKLIQIVV
jgi:predicted RNase H-like HicB family nuclease